MDAEEYLHLAARAAQDSNHHDALKFAHKSLELEPNKPEALFLLAAQHAEIGLYDRAKEGYRLSIEQKPDLHLARFQLAMLSLQSGEMDDLQEQIAYIETHADNPRLKRYTRALSAMSEENAELAIEHFEEGLALDSGSPEADDVAMSMLNSIRAHLAQASSEPEDAQYSKSRRAIDLSAYREDIS